MFALYDDDFYNDPEFQALRKLALKLGDKAVFAAQFAVFAAKHPEYNPEILRKSITSKKIPHLSTSIRNLFYICMGASVLGIIAAAVIFVISLL